jgi:hypothetical protein
MDAQHEPAVHWHEEVLALWIAGSRAELTMELQVLGSVFQSVTLIEIPRLSDNYQAEVSLPTPCDLLAHLIVCHLICEVANTGGRATGGQRA